MWFPCCFAVGLLTFFTGTNNAVDVPTSTTFAQVTLGKNNTDEETDMLKILRTTETVISLSNSSGLDDGDEFFDDKNMLDITDSSEAVPAIRKHPARIASISPLTSTTSWESSTDEEYSNESSSMFNLSNELQEMGNYVEEEAEEWKKKQETAEKVTAGPKFLDLDEMKSFVDITQTAPRSYGPSTTSEEISTSREEVTTQITRHTPSIFPSPFSTTPNETEYFDEATPQETDPTQTSSILLSPTSTTLHGTSAERAHTHTVIYSNVTETPDPHATVAIPSEKDLDSTILSNTTEINPSFSIENTTDTPLKIRYFVRITRAPLVNSKRRILLANSQFIETTPPGTSSSLEHSTSPSGEEDTTVPEPIYSLEDYAGQAEVNSEEQEHTLNIPTMKVFKPVTLSSDFTSSTTSNTMANVETVTTTTSMADNLTTSTNPPPNASAGNELFSITEPKITIKRSNGSHAASIAETSSPLKFDVTQSNPQILFHDSLDDFGDVITQSQTSELTDTKYPFQEHTTTESVTTITSDRIFPEFLNDNITSEDLFSQQKPESQELSHSLEVNSVQESTVEQQFTPLTSRSNKISRGTLETQTVQGVVVSRVSSKHAERPEEIHVSSRRNVGKSARQQQSSIELLIPIIPSVLPIRLKELPENPQLIQEDVEFNISSELPDQYLERTTTKTRSSARPQHMLFTSHSVHRALPSVASILTKNLESPHSSLEMKDVSERTPQLLSKKITFDAQKLAKPAAELPVQEAPGANQFMEEMEIPKQTAPPEEQIDSTSLTGENITLDDDSSTMISAESEVFEHSEQTPAFSTTSLPLEQLHDLNKVESLKPVQPMVPTKKQKIKPASAPARGKPELGFWWTSKPTFVEKSTMPSSTKPPRGWKVQRFRSNRKIIKQPSSNVHASPVIREKGVLRLPIAPLATAAAIGQLTYTTAVPSQFKHTSRRPFHLKESNTKRTTLLLVPETHLEKLQSELEILSSLVPSAVETMRLRTPIDRPQFGNPKRILHRRSTHKILSLPMGKNNRIATKMKRLATRRWTSHKIAAPAKASSSMEDRNLKKVVGETVKVNGQQKLDEDVDMMISPPKKKRQPKEGPSIVPFAPHSATTRALDLVLKPDTMATVSTNEPAARIKEKVMRSDMDELEQALREIAEQTDKTQSVSFFGDYRENVPSVDGETALIKPQKRPKVTQKRTRMVTTRGKGAKRNINSTLQIIPPPPPLDSDLLRISPMQPSAMKKLIDAIKHDNARLPASKQLCVTFECDFEKADLCGFESSLIARKRRRTKRAQQDAYFTMKRWNSWLGKHYDTNRRVDRAPVFSSTNQRFAGTLLNGQEMAEMSLKVITMEPLTVGFNYWEATPNMQMRACCDDNCPVTTNFGVHMGDRSWRQLFLQCPANTHTITFECMNFGNRRGACGIDNFSIQSQSCRQRAM
ncbi:hypothetical protein RB195_003159 [Necator americanus]|uniref:Uncharacterized protein n=1 Tax=Necator americanus TaxID=51031 RepID=A0ABR1DM94_NECAM